MGLDHFLSHLDSEQANSFNEELALKTYKKNEIIYHEGDEPKHLYFLAEGLIGLFNNSLLGKEHLFRIYGKGQCFGHRAISSMQPYHATSKALEACTIKILPIDKFNFHFERNPFFARCLLQKISTELKTAELRLASSVEKQVHQRIAETLLYLIDSFPEHKWTRNEIAFYCGSTGPTVIRTLAQFEDEGLIKQKGRSIHILNKDELAKIALINF